MGGLHSRCYQRFTEHYPDLESGFRLSIAVSRSEQLREEALTHRGFLRASHDALDAVRDPEVDIVSICSPTAEHADVAVAAAEAGKALWIEKPVGLTLAEARRVHDAVLANGVAVAVGHNYRSSPAIAEIRRRVLAGDIGTVELLRGRYDAGYAADPDAPLSWRFKSELAGGGASSDILSHLVDLAQYLNGPIVEAVGRTRITHRTRPVDVNRGAHTLGTEHIARREVENDDIAMSLMTFLNGAFGTFTASRVARSGENALEIELHGSKGYARWNSELPNEFYWRGSSMSGVSREYVDATMADHGRFLPGPGLGIGFDDVKLIELSGLVRQLRMMPFESATSADALRVAGVEDAIARSISSDRWCTVKNALDDE